MTVPIGKAVLAVVLTVFQIAACTRVEVESFRKVPESRAEAAYVKAGADFSRYTRLQVDPMGIYYPDGMAAPTVEELTRIRGIFREAYFTHVGDAYALADQPGADVLRARFSLVALKENADSLDKSQFGSRLAPLIDPGALTLLLELMDSQSGEVLARAADKQKIEATTGEGDADVWSQIDGAAQGWAIAFRNFLDSNLNR